MYKQGNTFVIQAVRLTNLLELAGVILVLLLAFLFQIFFRELPCPLCLLQRLGLLGVTLGLLLNLRYGFHPSHYAITLLSAIFASFVALRQISLHILPDTGSYGFPFLGLHLYTWTFIISMLIIIATTLMLSVDRQYLTKQLKNRRYTILIHVFFAVACVLVGINVISVLLQCGLSTCPDNPTHYFIP